MTVSDPSALVAALTDLATKLPIADDATWNAVESNARDLADSLRTKEPQDYHTSVGASSLPPAIKSLLDSACGSLDATPATSAASAATYELLRIGANICGDHDANRQFLLDAGVHERVATLLKAYSARPDASLTILDLKVVRTAIGTLLNASLGYEPVRTTLIALHAPSTVLNLVYRLGKPHGWVAAAAEGKTPDQVEDEWKMRSGIAAWGSRLISEFSEHDMKTSFTVESLPTIVSVVSTFQAPYPSADLQVLSKIPSRATFIQTDVELLDQASSLLEALTLDSPPFATALAASDGALLRQLVNFAENGSYPPFWTLAVDKTREKSFDLCKAAIIKTIIAAAGEEQNLNVLWQDAADSDEPHGWFVATMVRWIRLHAQGTDWGRDDLSICATLSLGNIARREPICESLAQPPLSIVTPLLALLAPAHDMKLKHGVLGLLKNISLAQRTRSVLGDAGLIEALTASRIWSRDSDFVDIVQLNAIGIVKHLCTANLDNTLRLVAPEPPQDLDPEQPAPATGLELILALVIRSDSIPIQSEGTRVISAVVRSLYTAEGDTATVGKRRRQAIDAVTTYDAASALASMILRSRKYVMLLNEGIVALTLMSYHSSGASYVLHAITATPPSDHSSPTSATATGLQSPVSPSSLSTSSVVTMNNALDMLSFIVSNDDGQSPPELRANVCSLFGALARKVLQREAEDTQVGRVKLVAIPLLNGVLQDGRLGDAASADEKTKVLFNAAQKALEAWQPPM